MEFEQLILAALQTKFAGVDAKILSRIAKKAAKTATGTTEADAKTIADGITLQQVIDSHADYRATEAQKTAVANYESKHKLKDGKPTEEPAHADGQKETPAGPEGKKSDEIPAWAQAIIDSNNNLKAELETYKSERTAKTRLEQFREAIKPLPDKVKARYEKDFARLTFKDDEDFAGYLTEIAPDITAITEQMSRQGAKVGSPLGSQGNGTEASALVKARFEATSKAEVAPAIAGLPTNNQS